jgi:hypothetical protein
MIRNYQRAGSGAIGRESVRNILCGRRFAQQLDAWKSQLAS